MLKNNQCKLKKAFLNFVFEIILQEYPLHSAKFYVRLKI